MYVCMYVCMYVYIYIYTYTYIYTSLSLSIYLSISLSLSLYINIYTYTYTHVYTYIHNMCAEPRVPGWAGPGWAGPGGVGYVGWDGGGIGSAAVGVVVDRGEWWIVACGGLWRVVDRGVACRGLALYSTTRRGMT